MEEARTNEGRMKHEAERTLARQTHMGHGRGEGTQSQMSAGQSKRATGEGESDTRIARATKVSRVQELLKSWAGESGMKG
eukprot:8676839-Alexandrium_andersonii.AAC.1